MRVLYSRNDWFFVIVETQTQEDQGKRVFAWPSYVGGFAGITPDNNIIQAPELDRASLRRRSLAATAFF
jgi:hypothetical protein